MRQLFKKLPFIYDVILLVLLAINALVYLIGDNVTQSLVAQNTDIFTDYWWLAIIGFTLHVISYLVSLRHNKILLLNLLAIVIYILLAILTQFATWLIIALIPITLFGWIYFKQQQNKL